jgi:integrase/recombinase XerD
MEEEKLIELLIREIEIRNFSNKTKITYVFAIKKFMEYAKQKDLNEDLVKNYIQQLLKIQNPSSVSVSLSAIEFFYKNVLKKTINIIHPKRNKPLPEVLTIQEVSKLIKITTNPKHKLIIKLLYGAGLRVSELTNLKKQDFDFEEEIIFIRQAKGKKDRIVKMPFSMKEELLAFAKLNQNNYFFPSNRNTKLSTATIRKIIKNSIKKAGITKNVHPHTLRHSYATHLLEQGTDLRIIQKLLGHADINNTNLHSYITTNYKKSKKPG